jgi:hypothetical protein
LGLLLSLNVTAASAAERISDIGATPHNLSVSSPGTVTAVTQDQMCVFCHTPHGAANNPGTPLWNRQLLNQTYTVYTSSSLDAEDIMGQLDQPGGSSKLCLSCHDGTLAIGTVGVLGGELNVDIPMSGVAPDGSMPPGAGVQTGATRDLSLDLTNDHPIALDYGTTLAVADGELRDPAVEAHIGLRTIGFRPSVPLEATGAGGNAQIQCATCHDPHIRGPDVTESVKFLRLNRLQESAPVGGAFDSTNDIACLACHDKQAWNTSAHAAPLVADEAYTGAITTLRDLPAGTPVWRAACLNCHDSHTVHGARRLLWEGTDAPGSPKVGGASAIEETCYQCHGPVPVVSNIGGEVLDIESDFLLPRRMPITSTDQPAGMEVHDVENADLEEPDSLLGKNALNNRHVECSDCHNPHRTMRNELFNGIGPDNPTHDHSGPHSNLASGALRGIWGVEPVYGSANFPSLPVSYQVKSGDGGLGASTAVTSEWLTREYQLCLKCHSDYAYFDDNNYPNGSRPILGSSLGGTPAGTNGLTQFTNQATEFQAPFLHRGNASATESGAALGYTINNHRSWHPVIGDTGRSAVLRGNMSPGAFLAPWDVGVGSQTMYCTDCHGSTTGPTTVVPSGVNPWGPHGSSNDFLLKGSWNAQTGGQSRDVPATDPNNGICFKCHDFRTYADRNGNDLSSGFSGDGESNLHAVHADQIEAMHCSWCHLAVPHGGKNKGLLVNLNDVGPEAGLPPGTEVPIGSDADAYTQEPYYLNSKLKIRTFATSGNWTEADCGSSGASIPGNDVQTGRDWMGDVCSNPP